MGAGTGGGLTAAAPPAPLWTSHLTSCFSPVGGDTQGLKTAISIPDDLFADAERLAQALKKSRSRLYGDAVREYLARHSAERVTDSLDALCAELAPGAESASGGGFARTAARRTLERSDW